MEESERSTVPVRHGFPNPKYQRVLGLLGDISQYRELALRVKMEAKKLGPNFKMEDLKNNCHTVKEELRALVRRNRSIPDTDPVLSAPPPTVELYGRFGRGVSVTDVGSGNCMKLRRYTGSIKFDAVDPNLQNLTGLVLKGHKEPFAAYLAKQPEPQKLVLSSWMSLPQLAKQEICSVLDLDGLHLVPDHQLLVNAGIATKTTGGDGEVLSVRTVAGVYEDYPVDYPGHGVSPGYLLVASYFARNVAIEVDFSCSTTGPVPSPCASPMGFYDLNFADITPKMDGDFYELECHQGAAYLTNRKGETFAGKANVDFHLCLHLERMKGCWVLLRVVMYRGFAPPHWGGGLRVFADKVSTTINEEPVLGPPRWGMVDFGRTVRLNWERGGEVLHYDLPTDGIITRIDGLDYYCKYMWTVDLYYKDLPNVKNHIREMGFSLDHPPPWGGLLEMSLVREGSVVTMRVLRPRVDKTQSTSLDTVLYLLDRPTLAEASVMTESNVYV